MTMLEWQNLIFLLPMLGAILYILMMAVGVISGEGGDLDADHDVHVEVGHDVSPDAGHDADAGHGGAHLGLLERALGLLGVGKVPLSILCLSFGLIWGAAGLVLNAVLGVEGMRQNILFAALAALLGGRTIAEGLAYLLPREESYHTPKADLVGQVGEVMYEVTHSAGTVRLSDPSGNLLDLDCRIEDGPDLKAGTRVVLHKYDSAADVFFVRGEPEQRPEPVPAAQGPAQDSQ
jgi:hypothetical protein